VSCRFLYFASLRDAAGVDQETVESPLTDARALYARLRERHGFTLGAERLRVAINGAFASWEQPLADGDEVVFIPPVSGG
jgi:molybdopterin synthase sulfur carrier subunit